MKNIVYYIRRKEEPLIAKVTEAAIAGLRHINLDFEIKYEDEYEPSEIAILFGFHKNVNKIGKLRKFIYDGQKDFNKKIMVLERGFIKRNEYHSVGWDGINGRANFNNKKSPNDRLKFLNIKLKPWKDSGNHILICAQVPWDAAVQHLNTDSNKGIDGVQGYLGWLGSLTKELIERERGKREIVFRPHPLFKRHEYYKQVIPKDVRWSENSFEEDLKDAWACFAFNSNSIVEAIIEGVHGFVSDEGSVVYNYANKRVKLLKKPNRFDREQCLSDLAYAQWNLNELSQGTFWKVLNEER